MAETGRTLHANLHLLDRQVVDAENGRLRGKVDDLELDLTSDPPVLAAFLGGPPAWGPRLPGFLGRTVVAVHRRLHLDREPGPDRIPAAMIVDVDPEVRVASHAAAQVQGFQAWMDNVIKHIPGAGDAPE